MLRALLSSAEIIILCTTSFAEAPQDGRRALFRSSLSFMSYFADATFVQLQARITTLENEIADRREYYNDSVNIHNIGIEKLPDVFVARFMNYRRKPLWKIVSAHRSDVPIKFGA